MANDADRYHAQKAAAYLKRVQTLTQDETTTLTTLIAEKTDANPPAAQPHSRKRDSGAA